MRAHSGPSRSAAWRWAARSCSPSCGSATRSSPSTTRCRTTGSRLPTTRRRCRRPCSSTPRMPTRCTRGGEPVWPGRSDAELVECSRHESLLNLAFDGGRAWRLLCPYDARARRRCAARRVPQPPAARARQRVVDERRLRGPRAVLARPDSLRATDRAPSCVRRGRARVVRRLSPTPPAAGLRATARDLVLAVNELAANPCATAAARRRAHVGRRRHVRLRGRRQRIADPLAGRSAVQRRESGRGLWIVNHLCDLVQVRSTKAGNVVRLHMSLA